MIKGQALTFNALKGGYMAGSIKRFIAREWIALVLAAALTFFLWVRFPATETAEVVNPSYLDHAYRALNTRGLLGVAYGVSIYGIYVLLRITIGAVKAIAKK
jgi:hypothetical protein